jgi:nitrate/nitrite transport system permease protein
MTPPSATELSDSTSASVVDLVSAESTDQSPVSRRDVAGGGLTISPAAPPPQAGRSHAKVFAEAVLWPLVGFAVLLSVWQFGSWRVADLPSPNETFGDLRHLLATALHDGGPNDKGVGLLLWASLGRVFEGFGLAAIVGVPFGLLVGTSRRAFAAANPVIQLLRPVSPLAWYPIWLIITANAPKAAVWVIFITSIWPIVINTAAGAATVPRDQRNVAKVFHLRRGAYVRHVLLPHTLPSVVTGMRLSMGVAWMVIVASEMLSGTSGIGNYVWNSYNGGNMAHVSAAIILIGSIGLVLDLAFLRLGKAVSTQETHS